MTPEESDHVEELWDELLRQITPTYNNLESSTMSLPSSSSALNSLNYHHHRMDQRQFQTSFLQGQPQILVPANDSAAQSYCHDRDDEWFERLSRNTLDVIESLTKSSSPITSSVMNSPSTSLMFQTNFSSSTTPQTSSNFGNSPASGFNSLDVGGCLNCSSTSPSSVLTSSPASLLSISSRQMANQGAPTISLTISERNSHASDPSKCSPHSFNFSSFSTLNLNLNFTESELILLDLYTSSSATMSTTNTLSASSPRIQKSDSSTTVPLLDLHLSTQTPSLDNSNFSALNNNSSRMNSNTPSNSYSLSVQQPANSNPILNELMTLNFATKT
ncbi:hypothetical protein FDP41_010758 [Naegleria fowleri]|uniref:Uncharacterized protein n=1 Tax=Naegleria fowleri TaxID=5763 RepID=A0A6A5CBY7_NAEFO|nr:uncharacterized protein FDP41_010758 [Naegleria fowleri]KAF0982779.1 hypothetical protein FDP41_010758 [Naegleria fowleri]